MPAVTGKVEGKRMKKILIAVVPFMLAGCSYYNQFVERMQTDTLEYQCDQKPLTVHRNNSRQQVSFIYDNQQLNLSEGLSASGARYTDGVYDAEKVVFFGGRMLVQAKARAEKGQP